MFEGMAFILECTEEVFEADNGKSYAYTGLRLLPLGVGGVVGDAVKCTGGEGLEFEGMGTYRVWVNLRERNNRAGFRVERIVLVKAM